MVQDLIYTDDLVFENGDIKVAFSEDQHIEHILKAGKGNFYRTPEIGANIPTLLKGGANAARIKQVIKENLELDEFRILSLKVNLDSEGELNIEIKADKIQ